MWRSKGSPLLRRLGQSTGITARGLDHQTLDLSLKDSILLKDSVQARAIAYFLPERWQSSSQMHSFHSSPASCSQNGKDTSKEEAASASNAGQPEPDLGEAEASNPYSEFSQEDLLNTLLDRDASLAARNAEVEGTTEMLKRTLADMENLRQRSARQAENTKKYAVQGFLKSMLEVGDNLERAHEAVPPEALQGKGKDGQPLTSEQAAKLLNGIVNGVKLTEKIFDQGLKANAVEKYSPMGDKFDPNLHEALFEVPDASLEPGTIAAVTKTGYTLQGRVVRPAQVGVARKP